MKGNKKGFCKYIRSRRKTGENTEKAEGLDAFFALIFIGKMCLLESQASETSGKGWSNEDLALAEKDQVREHLNIFALRKSMEPDRMHL